MAMPHRFAPVPEAMPRIIPLVWESGRMETAWRSPAGILSVEKKVLHRYAIGMMI